MVLGAPPRHPLAPPTNAVDNQLVARFVCVYFSFFFVGFFSQADYFRVSHVSRLQEEGALLEQTRKLEAVRWVMKKTIAWGIGGL